MPSPPAPGAEGDAAASTSKRRRSSDPGWASLPEDLVRLVASRLLPAGDLLLDYVRFRAVCRGWRSGKDSPRGRGVTDPLFHPRRWMMLPEGHGLYPGHAGLGGYASFLSLDTGRMAQKKLTNMACAAASFGTRGGGGAITIVLALHQVHRVAFASSLDEQWTLASWPLPSCHTPFAFRGKLYILHTPSQFMWQNVHQVLQIDPPVQDGATSSGFSLKPPRLIATIPVCNLLLPMCLVESDSNILLIGHKDSSMSRILVYKLADLVQQRFLPMKSIGDNCLIVGERSMSVSSRVLPTVEGDSEQRNSIQKEDTRWVPYEVKSMCQDEVTLLHRL
ncbi:unnamed protein product [Miscanthus lutarioriparius]|uniref:KIB1-4 beta-propeller domain-containing protein n=1 Tax=Miscanthus lutarioriparius TaxID=422564 RepID=A0A811RDQ1_9POAL|nr:unnamed protein product [Miscanthus lutarioriparius]